MITGALAIAGSIAIGLVARSMPQRAPTKGDCLTSLALFGGMAVVAVLVLVGGAAAVRGLVVARAQKLPAGPCVAALVLNALPPAVGFLGDALGWWFRKGF